MKIPKKPRKPKSKTNKSLESYIIRVKQWERKISQIKREKAKNEALRARVARM